MRTDDEIIARVKAITPLDHFGFKASDLVATLPFETASQFLDRNANAWSWEQAPRDADAVLARIVSYLPFAWRNANNRRGLSAMRSLDHMTAWLWLLGHDVDLGRYTHYGKPQLRAISEAVGFDWAAHDDGNWTNNELESGAVLPAADIGLPSLMTNSVVKPQSLSESTEGGEQ
ncbi:hypothetical protein [Azorhizobium doebereinerae]|uniref:hypothetical protein n=1 Tax=Azorhizobium doebereinerae TaxID=281091 RepID=UPI0003FC19D0|nr:hypothetical protein [Azorhizobium doebereinerae]